MIAIGILLYMITGYVIAKRKVARFTTFVPKGQFKDIEVKGLILWTIGWLPLFVYEQGGARA